MRASQWLAATTASQYTHHCVLVHSCHSSPSSTQPLSPGGSVQPTGYPSQLKQRLASRAPRPSGIHTQPNNSPPLHAQWNPQGGNPGTTTIDHLGLGRTPLTSRVTLPFKSPKYTTICSSFTSPSLVMRVLAPCSRTPPHLAYPAHGIRMCLGFRNYPLGQRGNNGNYC